MSELPLINRTKLYVKMDAKHEAVYDEAVEEFVQWYEAQMDGISGMAIIAAMQLMRHMVGRAKIPATLEYVEEFVEDTDRKLVVFAHHKDVQSILYDELKARYESDEFKKENDGKIVPVYRITSEMSGQDRYDAQVAFNESPRCIMVASTLAAGEGLNLQTCADCVMHERQWNPANEEQAEGRFIRIGQTAETVNATYAEMQGLTVIDPQLDSIIERKRIQFHAAMSSGEPPRWNQDAIMKELADSIVRAHKAKKRRAS